MHNIPLSQHDISEAEKQAVLDVLAGGRLALGPKLPEFEQKLAAVAGTKYAVALNSGTSALHLIVKALGIKAGDEVITTPFSFVASANCILYEGATPVFADIDPVTLNIDVTKIEEKITPETKAILAVDVFSRPADWEQLQQIAKKHKLLLIEDSAEALASTYQGKPCGSFGDAGVFAFYPNKQITTGEGGAVVTNNKEIADFCRSAANQGRKIEDGKWLEHVRLGYNYRISEMNCALGIAQLSRLSELLAKKAAVANRYQQLLKDVPGITLPADCANGTMSWFVYVILLPKILAGQKRDQIIKQMGERGIACSNYFYPIHLQPFYKEQFGYKEGDFPVAEDVGSRALALPFFNNLTQEQAAIVVENLKELLAQ